MTREKIGGHPPPNNEVARPSRGGEARPEHLGNSTDGFVAPIGPAGQSGNRAPSQSHAERHQLDKLHLYAPPDRMLRQGWDGAFTSAPMTAVEAATAWRVGPADARWFGRHRGRSYRLRPAIAGEIPGLSVEKASRAWMVIRGLTSGCRVKIIVYPARPPLEDTEELAHALYDLAQAHGRAGIPTISGEAIDAMVDLLRRGGPA